MAKHIIVSCEIHIGPNGVNHPPTRMWDYEPESRYCAISVDGNSAVCRRCHHELDRDDLQFRDLTKVSCSNCYSDGITLTSIRFEMSLLFRKDAVNADR